jgi:energy-coupling factor transporter ATP-binding protein EcfA2
MLALSRRWDRELSDDEQQSLAFARVVLHAPSWVLIDEVLDSIDEETRERVLNIFATDLKHTGIIHIGRGRARDPVFARVLHLIKGSNDTQARPPSGAGSARQTRAAIRCTGWISAASPVCAHASSDAASWLLCHPPPRAAHCAH